MNIIKRVLKKTKTDKFTILREKLTRFVKSQYHCIVDDMPSMVVEFLNANPELKQTFVYHDVLYEADRLSERGWN